MLAADWTALFATERIAELHRQAEGRRLTRLARALRRGGNLGVSRESRCLASPPRGRVAGVPETSPTP
jgi:hypothetical protein